MGEPRRRPTRTWESIIKMDLEEIVCDAVDGLVCPRLGTIGSSCEHFVPQKTENILR